MAIFVAKYKFDDASKPNDRLSGFTCNLISKKVITVKVITLISKSCKILIWTAMALILLLGAVLLVIYSSWGQEHMKELVVEMLNRNGMKAEIAELRLHFPLDIEIEGLSLDMPAQSIKAGSLDASVKLLPLLTGHAKLSEANLTDGYFSMGSPDTTMCMVISGRDIALRDADVKLSSMDIHLADGAIRGGNVSMLLNPDTTTVDTVAPPAEPTEMKIRVDRLSLAQFGFDMRMLPTIDSLSAVIPNGVATKLNIDLKSQTIGVGSFTGSELNACYIVPDSATIAATPVVPPSTTSSAPWTINIDTIGFSSSEALYTTRGVKPLPGLDFTYIQADSLDLSIHDFYNQASIVKVPLSISATERCGVRLQASGTLDVDSTGTRLVGFKASTPLGTDLAFNFLLGMGDMTTDPSTALGLNLDGGVSVADARLMFPAFAPYFVTLPGDSKLYATIDVSGTAGNLEISDMSLVMNGTARLKARGRVENAFQPENLGGNLELSGALIDLNQFKSVLFDKATAKQINLPMTTFDGDVNMSRGHVAGNLTAHTHDGRISLDADWHSRLKKYDVKLIADRFPVNAFMPLMGIGEISATADVDGTGYDPFSTSTKMNADLKVTKAIYQGYDYKGIDANVKLADGKADISLNSTNPNAMLSLDASGNLDGNTYKWIAHLDGEHINLQALNLSTEPGVIAADLTATASITPKPLVLGAKLDLASLSYTDKITTTTLNDIVARLNANDSVTNVSLQNRDLYAFFSSESSLDSIMGSFTRVSQVISGEIAAMKIDVIELQKALPPFTLDITAGKDNMLTDLLSESRSSFESLHVLAANDSVISLEAQMLDLQSPSMRLDTINFNITQHGPYLALDGEVENRPGTFDEWAHVKLAGFLAQNRMGIRVTQHNIQDKEGYNLGIAASIADSVLTVSLKPVTPTIAYKPWTVNEDNYLKWSFAHKHLDANLHMSSEKSSLAIYTEHVSGEDEHQEDLVVSITDIHLADWIKLNPFAPPISGDLSADMRIGYENNNLNGNGFVALNDFMYNRKRVGSIRSNIDLSTDLTGLIKAKADLSVDGQQAITLTGALNDSTAGSPLAMDLSLIHFPLATVNPFLPADVASLTGTLNGSMDVTGEGSDPRLNGWLQFDSTAVKLVMTGTDYAFNDVKIPVEENVVKFNNFNVMGTNENPLSVNGSVDIKSFSNPKIDLDLTANNMMIVNTKRAARGADIYGRGFINLNATAKGDMSFMAVNANLSILSGTNITYVMTDAATALTATKDNDMVKFVNFADTAAVNRADSLSQEGMAMLLDASLTIQTGSTINVDLSTNGRNRVSVQPDGTVDFTMPPFGQPRLTGRINIPNGFVRYTPQFMSEKNFSFESNSYVAFNGDMMNPTLNIHAVDVVKANVTQTGQNSRLVDFNILLGITGTLESMDVAFDLTTDDDITVANELQGMSAEQRANQAMNMLLYNVYSGPGTRGDSNLSGNAVYSFLTSQLNNWAANTIKGVDLTFGVDQYDRTIGGSTSQTTSYSYQVSKSLFNDRFKIVVGGNYSTDTNADENFSQNLIKDISFEYFINKAQTMYVRLFRHTGWESILEGEVTKTGVGFVYKRKAPSLKGLFRRQHRRKEVTVPDAAAGQDSKTETDNPSQSTASDESK